MEREERIRSCERKSARLLTFRSEAINVVLCFFLLPNFDDRAFPFQINMKATIIEPRANGTWRRRSKVSGLEFSATAGKRGRGRGERTRIGTAQDGLEGWRWGQKCQRGKEGTGIGSKEFLTAPVEPVESPHHYAQQQLADRFIVAS